MVMIGWAMTFAAAACGSSNGTGTAAGSATTTTPPVPSTAVTPSAALTDLTLRITDVRLTISEESDRGVRVLLPAGVATASVSITGLPSPNRVISVCQAQDLDGDANGAVCRTPTGGEPVTVTLGAAAKGVEVVHVAVPPTPSATNSFTLDEVTIRYAASSREVSARLPPMAPGDAGGRPTLGLTPAGPDGAYRATLNWKVIASFGGTPSNAQLELVEGAKVTNQAAGAGDVRFNGTVSTPGATGTIRVQNPGPSLLVTPKLTALLP